MAEEERDFAGDELSGDDNRQAAIPQAGLRELPNYTNHQEGSEPTSNYTNPQEGTEPAWLQCKNFQSCQHKQAKTSHKPVKPTKVVRIKNETTTTRQKGSNGSDLNQTETNNNANTPQ
jgi:hypothetical protein